VGTLAITLEVTGDANAFGVVTAETGISAVDLFERIDHPVLRQAGR
jgi:hypothetical protein